jgi:hypothetical protein
MSCLLFTKNIVRFRYVRLPSTGKLSSKASHQPSIIIDSAVMTQNKNKIHQQKKPIGITEGSPEAILQVLKDPLHSFRMRQMRSIVTVVALLSVSVAAFLPPTIRRHDGVGPLYDASRDQGAYKGGRSKKKPFTIADLRKEIMKDPALYNGKTTAPNKAKSQTRRTRKKTDNPQQQYLYAAQREQLSREGPIPKTEGEEDVETEETVAVAAAVVDEFNPLVQARQFGLVDAAGQHCEALMDEVKPKIMGQIRVGDEAGSGAFAYLIYKPAGWAILGGAPTNNHKKTEPSPSKEPSSSTTKSSDKPKVKRIKIKGGGSSGTVLEFNEADIMAAMTPEEREEFKAEGGSLNYLSGPAYDDTSIIQGWGDVATMTPEERAEAGIEDEDFDPSSVMEYNEADVLALMTPEERLELGLTTDDKKAEHGFDSGDEKGSDKAKKVVSKKELDPKTIENFKRIEARSAENKLDASFASVSRLSVVSWLKELKAEEGNPIRGGNFWKAIAGATSVDDSGLVLLCPKDKVDNVFVDFAEYVTVIGNGNFLAPKPKTEKPIPNESVEMAIMAKVRKGRGDDTTQTVRITIPEHMSTCSSIVAHAQEQFKDGIRGDPAGNPFDRRASRRLIHCNVLSVSSLVYDEEAQAASEFLPDDIAILAERLNHHEYKEGSFLGRSSLRQNPLTTAYREINGAADGFPGWTVDRYGDWLFVQHDEKEYRGPLPSIHDGNTAGVYYLPANPDRSSMGSGSDIRPILIEGRPAPDVLPIKENGVAYLVSLDKDLSTGIFLDQRLHRAWLARNCNKDTRVLNCFAHCGAFSIAAATAGAATVSLDLNKKWLDRVQPQLEANGIVFDERHDCIYGDCK